VPLSATIETPFPATTLFPESTATVVGLPPAFHLDSALREATTIRLATAFAHIRGWNLLEGGVIASKGKVFLLTGLDFLQTEPKLLHKWLQLTANKRFQSSLLTKAKSTFHPKVLIVQREASPAGFAIVGSGNLSEGGLRTNIECSLLVDDPSYLSALTRWFDDLFSQAQPLTRRAIEEYEPRYEKARKVLAKVRSEQKATEQILLEQQRVTFKNREEAIKEARDYFRLPEYERSHEKRLKALDEIKRALHYPTFSFDKKEWAEFFSIHEMGRLRLAWREPLFKKAPRLRAALGHLVDDATPDNQRLASLLDKRGKYHIRGLGINVVSKVLAVHNPATWPVYNDCRRKDSGALRIRGSTRHWHVWQILVVFHGDAKIHAGGWRDRHAGARQFLPLVLRQAEEAKKRALVKSEKSSIL